MPDSEAADTAREAWKDFCSGLAEAGGALLASHDDLDRAEGLRYLSRLIGIGLDLFVENRDPARPELTRILGPHRKFGIDNPDTIYHYAPIDGAAAYRIRGNRNDADYLAFTVYSGSVTDLSGGDVIANVIDADLDTDPGGLFELMLAPEGHGAAERNGSVITLTDDSSTLVIRQYMLDLANSRPAAYTLERIDYPGRPRPIELETIAGGLRGTAAFVRAVSGFMPDAVERLAAEPNQLQHFPGRDAGRVFAAPDNEYMIGYFDLAESEALVVEGRPPDARYWNFHLCNIWAESLDYESFRVALNQSEIILTDGEFRIVVAHSDPGQGEPNWISTAGHRSGLMVFRWLLSKDIPEPRCRVVDFAELAVWSEI